jgi:hypothetical protein
LISARYSEGDVRIVCSLLPQHQRWQRKTPLLSTLASQGFDADAQSTNPWIMDAKKRGYRMRNLAIYPITEEEKIDAVREAIQRSLADGGVGDIAPAALAEVLNELETRNALLKATAGEG